MTGAAVPAPTIRTAVPADLPELQRVFRAASLPNPPDAPLLLAHAEFLHFAGEGVAEGLQVVAFGGSTTCSSTRSGTAAVSPAPSLWTRSRRWGSRGVAACGLLAISKRWLSTGLWDSSVTTPWQRNSVRA